MWHLATAFNVRRVTIRVISTIIYHINRTKPQAEFQNATSKASGNIYAEIAPQSKLTVIFD